MHKVANAQQLKKSGPLPTGQLQLSGKIHVVVYLQICLKNLKIYCQCADSKWHLDVILNLAR